MKMKRIGMLVLVFIIGIGVIFSSKVYATDDTKLPSILDEGENTGSDDEGKQEPEEDKENNKWTDVSSLKFNIISDNALGYRDYELKIEGITYKEGSVYTLYIDNSSTKPTSEDKQYILDSETTKIRMNKYFEKSGDINVWLTEKQAGEEKDLITITKIERPEQLALGTRMHAVFTNEKTNTFLYEANETNGKKIKVKIGYVTDKTVLKNIRDKKSNALNELLTYAKSAKALYNETINLGETEAITDKLNISDKNYYYVYMQLEDEGKYYQVEDVSLYQGLKSSSMECLIDYLSDDFKWNITDDEEKPADNNIINISDGNTTGNNTKKDNTTASGKIPQTGINTIVTMFIAIGAIVVAVSYMQYRRYKDIK